MLRLFLGTDWIANRDAILGELRQDVAREKPNRILLVPELISHDMERRLCAAAGDTASRFAQVLSFSRLVRRVAEWEQRSVEETLDAGGRLVAMASALRQLSSVLKSYASVETKPEFLESLLDGVDEFKRCCISPGDLKAASEQTQGTLAQKLWELSMMLESYDSVCAQSCRDPRDQMNWLLELLEASDFGKTHTIYIDGFPDLTRQNLAIVAHFLEVSPMVTVSLTCDAVGSQAPAFETPGKTARELVRLAQSLGVAVEQRIIPGRRDALLPVRQGLFQGNISPDPQLSGHLQTVRCDSVFDECQWAAEQVRRLNLRGARYRDIGILCPSLKDYEGVASLVFRRCGIALYQSGTDDILEKTAISTVLSALDAALEGLEQREVLRYLKSMLSTVALEECDRLENYAVLWGIRGDKWGREWTMHPRGLVEQWTPEDRKELDRLNEARSRGLGPLIRLGKGFRTAQTLSQQVSALLTFLDDIRLAETLEKRAGEAQEAGDLRAAQEYHQLWEILLTALEQLSDVLGRTKWEPAHFTRLFRLLLSQYDVGTIPPVLDSVTMGDVSAMRCQQVRHLIVLGASEGSLPGYAGSQGVLTDAERTELRRLGIPLTGGGMEGVAAEFAQIYGCFCGASESIHVSFSGGQPSVLYRRLCAMTGDPDGREAPVSGGLGLFDPWEAGAYLARSGSRALAEELSVQDGYREARDKASFTLGAVSPEAVRSLYGSRLTLSASQIDRQSECRMSYFLRYGLLARERKEAAVDPAEYGTFVHAVLEQTGREVMARGGFHAVSLEDIMDLARGFAAAYTVQRFSDLDSQRLQYLFRRNAAELELVVEELWRELSESAFEPVAFELGFDRGAAMEAVELPSGAMEAVVRGFVDRVDLYQSGPQNYFRVVDYKTGRKDFDYCDVFNGVGLQMLLYLFALERHGSALLGEHPVSAGVQYFPARVPYLTEDGRLTAEEAAKERLKEQKRRGLVLNDEKVIEAMDPSPDLKRLSLKRKADGTVTGDLAGSEQLGMLRRYLMRFLSDMVGEIARGNVTANPYTRGASHNACAFCPYGAVCAGQREQGRRNYKAMTAQRFWEEIEKEVQRHG